jgi:hypothetical protein
MVMRGAGAFLDGSVCEPIWRILNQALRERRRDGGMVRPDILEAVEALRTAASVHLVQAMCVCGHVPRTSMDIALSSVCDEPDLLTTVDLARMLGVGDHHARRLAKTHNIAPAARNAWRRADALALLDDYRRRTAR